MPRFFFHIREGVFREIDPVGCEFASLEHAIIDARKAAREILAERIVADEPIDRQQFEITDEKGKVLETVPFRSVLRMN